MINLKHIKITKNKNIKKKYLNPLRNNKIIITSFHLKYNINKSIKINLTTPYKNNKQKKQLIKKKTKIKNNFIISTNTKKINT